MEYENDNNALDQDQPTCNPPGGGSWTWKNGAWSENISAESPEVTESEATE